ncbi:MULTISPECIES: HVO_A0114 family putative DNA-binding protein [Vibrio harveyi group]|uniref:HVO_A0114 family putative DNA-binding protein n=1 Tax=Vibrio harveyi group TaxID=717610 RepID=UPI0009409BFD|nr:MULTISPECIES: transcriptional regulator [Vibrio harveyi group]EKL9828588.1 transcriptional regulator [Vibrio alginolyticus]ELC3206437.1 transcriptional regulator [Vibrio parahaemolyticus]MCS0163399.1 transcriptional regulator [Vibrio alginolyticus]MCS0210304.1 transcriptional regulator [Vibrio alginolyticus]OKQ17945.1 transcriptional regulator [Vibrio antiquarius]
MKARIGIASEELVRKYILDVAAGKLNHVKDMPQFWFASLTELSQVLTNDNIKLLNMMAYERPNSVAKLAEITDRSVEELSISIKKLTSKGFVRIEICGNEERLTAIYTSFEILMGKEVEARLLHLL